jgi:hypothetical protein
MSWQYASLYSLYLTSFGLLGRLIYGFVTRDDVCNALQGHDNGTFMIRFSERHAGQFAISYVQGGLVKHYLVQATDTAGARKTLGDFVLEQAQYVELGFQPSFYLITPILMMEMNVPQVYSYSASSV